MTLVIWSGYYTCLLQGFNPVQKPGRRESDWALCKSGMPGRMPIQIVNCLVFLTDQSPMGSREGVLRHPIDASQGRRGICANDRRGMRQRQWLVGGSPKPSMYAAKRLMRVGPRRSPYAGMLPLRPVAMDSRIASAELP